MTPITRRRLLASAGAGAAGLGIGGAAGFLVGQETAEASSDGTGSVPFYGEHQAGIDTAAQDRLHFAAFDLVTNSRAELRELMREWSRAAAEMTAGEMIGDANSVELAPPEDTGETVGLLPSRLTVTVGFGPSLFERRGLGLRGKRPAALREIPPLPGRRAQPRRKRRRHLRAGLLRRPAGRLPRDPQPGPDRPRHRGHALVPARLRPHLDDQPQPGHAAQPDGLQGRHREHPRRGHRRDAALRLGRRRGPAWMRGGSYLVSRRIRMLLEIWDRSALEDQERRSAATSTRGRRWAAQGVRPARPRAERAANRRSPPTPTSASPRPVNDGERILRRGYSFTDGVDESLGELEAGLFFICFQRDPQRQFVPIQRRLGSNDALNEYIKHVGSAVFAVPPGARQGGYVGETCSAESDCFVGFC